MKSTYGQNAFLVMVAISLGGWFISLLVTIGLVYYGRRHSSHRDETLPKVVVVSLNICFGCALLLFASISGFGYFHPALAVMIGCLLWAVSSLLSVFLLFGQWRLSAVESAASHIETSAVSMFIRKMIAVCQKKAKLCNVLCCIGYGACYAIVFVMYGMCYCSNPFELTSWSSRRSQPTYCFEDQFCHQYTLLGRNYSRVRVVGHVVSSRGRPRSTDAHLCLWDVDAQVPDCSSLNITFSGTLVDHVDELGEDPRYVSHILLMNLNASTVYVANVRIVLADGTTVRKSISFRTVPKDRSDLTFISGGDLYSTNEGQWLLFVAFAAQSNPSFVLFGGDLAYTNNLRTCYIRFDYFLALATSLRTSQGLWVPLVVIPGNHESGGYLLEQDPQKYNFFLPFFPQYDDDTPQHYGITYHTHDVAQLTILGLDSCIMTPCATQIPYIEAMLAEGALRNQTLIASYHNPMFPSVREYTDSQSVAVRDAWLNVFLAHNLTLALEFHDHAYKRTHLVNALRGSSALNDDGIIFIGDGGLGTARSTSSGRIYLSRFSGESNIQLVQAYANGTLLVNSFGAGRTLLDSISIRSRTRG